jgi:hypothetical protein
MMTTTICTAINSTGAIHFGINCFGICGDADGNGDPNGASNELTSAGGSDNPDFKLSESFCLGMDLGGGAANEPGVRARVLLARLAEREREREKAKKNNILLLAIVTMTVF